MSKHMKPLYAKIPVWILIAGFFLFCPDLPGQSQDGYSHIRSVFAGNIAARWPHEESDLKPDPAVIFGRLPNGFRYVLMENHEPEDRVNISLNVQTGSMFEENGQEGLAHYLEHMLFCGSTHFKPGELVKYFQDMGMRFGPDANAHTGFYETVYDILLPDGGKESLDKGFLIVEDFAKGALLLESEVDRERRVILAEKRSRDSASYRTFVSTMKFKFPDSKISKRFPIGVEEVLESTTPAQLKDFYETWYRPENIILVMVGDFDPDTAISLIEKRFSGFFPKAGSEPSPSFGNIKHEGVKAFYHYEKEAGNTSISIESVEKTETEIETSEVLRNRFITEIADRIVQNRLDTMVRKKKAPFTSASIGSGYSLRRIRYAEISAESSPQNWEESLKVIDQTLRQALSFGFTRQEYERVKKDITAMLDNAVKQASTRDSQILANEIIWNLNNNKVFRAPWQEKEFYSSVLESIDLKILHNSFINTWKASHRLVIITGNAVLKGDVTPEELITKVYRESSQKAVSKPIENKPVFFPYLPEPEVKGVIKARKEFTDLGIVQIDFENGVRLNLKKTDFEANEIRANLSFGYGRSGEPFDLEGISELSEAVINESGLGELDKDEMEKALAGKSSRVDFSVDDGRFIFTGRTISDEAGLLFQLLYAYVIDPGYRKEAYLLSLERFDQKYKELSRLIDGAMTLSGERFLAGGDHRFGFPSPEKLKMLSLDHVRSWIDPQIKNDPVEISVVGDFEEEKVIELVSLYFGSLSERSKKSMLKTSGVPVFPSAKSHEINVETEDPKSIIFVAYPTEDIWNIGRTRRFNLLGEIVSEKIREEIRESMGAAYSYSAYNNPSRAYPGYGIFYTEASVSPKKSSDVEKRIKNIVSNVVKNGITDGELKRALDPVLTTVKDMLRKNNYWLKSVLTESVRYPQQIEWCRTIKEDYESITASELNELAGKYLDNTKAASIIIKPVKLSEKKP
ncbi:MAG: insulinase family protein [Desulfobacterales bacterium]